MLKPMPMLLKSVTPWFVLILGSFLATTVAAEPKGQELERVFAETVQPFVKSYCLSCHDKEKQKGKLDLSTDTTPAAVAKNERRWAIMLERLETEEMPPEKAPRQPTAEERRAVSDWIRAWRKHEAQRNAGDPGPVLARRLSNAEYDYTIRDLTGVDIRPTREFPIDPANESGFDNSGESLAMSPDLVKKYLAAARLVADHIVLKPRGFVFAPHPTVTDTDRDKYCVKRIIEFYNRQPTDLADYFLAAWRFQHRGALDKPDATLADFAAEKGLSAKYLEMIWSTVTDSEQDTGPLAELRKMWRELPAPIGNQPEAARRGCEQMREVVVRLRQGFSPDIKNLTAPGISNGSQSLVLWKNRQFAANRLRYAGPVTTEANDAALRRFCEVFPDAFYLAERGRIFLDENESDKGRLLSAGFHLMVGYFRDDEPLRELLLDEHGRRELDALWQEFQFITFAPMRQYKDFIFFERAEPPRFMAEEEFDFARSEDKDATSAKKVNQLSELYLAKARKNGGSSEAIKAVEDYFTNISAEIRWVEQTRLAAEPSHLAALQAFGERAYRRQLSPSSRDELLSFYRSLRESGLDHEESIRDVVVSVLMSPHFCYRIDPPEMGTHRQPLSDYSLASRLSYFLWSSMPDHELLAHAAAGDLHNPEILIAQTRRMLRDDRIRGLATEFGGNWLDFRSFEQHNSVDRERFTEFTSELRQAMFEEPIRFFVDVARQDGSVLDFLDGGYTFVNPILAKHYGIPITTTESNEWVRVDDAGHYGRGGLLPMSVFLTKNAPGLRTSPVKRGYWVIRRLLGEHIAPPPQEVPELPKDEKQLGDLTLRQLLARHRESKSCAGCHEHFDAIGLVFEGYGPIGERRDKDLGGRLIDSQATFPDGSVGTGLEGLRDYLREHRQEEFIDNLSRKLLAYALGRSLQVSDDATLGDMRANLVAEQYRLRSLVETIVTSSQFRFQRGRDYDVEPIGGLEP